jgi:hypothetical protein
MWILGIERLRFAIAEPQGEFVPHPYLLKECRQS